MRVNRLSLAIPFFTACIATAAEAPLPTIGDLSRVQSETLITKAKAKLMEAKAELHSNSAKAGENDGGNTSNAAVVVTELPTVTGISGRAGRLYATFRFPNGTTATARSGENLPGGYYVSEVSLNRAVLTMGDKRFPLQHGVVSQQPSQQQMPGMPGFGAGMIPPSPGR